MEHHRESFQSLLKGSTSILMLAPMQDVTTQAYWKIIARYGGADVYVTEYFRVHAVSRLDRDILRCVTENPTGRPVVAQLIGNDIPSLVRSARELQQLPVAAVDLNLGCPAPVVYRKCAGSGLLRFPEKVDAILGALRDALHIPFTVKTRIGFDHPEQLERLLPLFARHKIDLLTVHGRLVPQGNTGPVNYDLIAQVIRQLSCPVIANGNIHSAQNAQAVLDLTAARGLMLGRGAIRNPWLFEQIRQHREGRPVFIPSGRDVFNYVRALHHDLRPAFLDETTFVSMLKKYLTMLGDAIEPTGEFLYRIRRIVTEADLFDVCGRFLDHERPMPLNPFPPADFRP